MQLSASQMVHLEGQGFLSLDSITDSSEVARIRSEVQGLFVKETGKSHGAFFDMLAPGGEPGEMSLVQIKNISDYAPALAKTQFVRNAKSLARQILGSDAKLWFDMVILKPARCAAATPWHQDEAYCDPAFEHQEITFWMPLQDAAEENGCMSFIPGSHKGVVLSHRSPGNDPTVHALECCDNFERGEAIICPLPAGGCSIHYGRTLHTAGGNRSDHSRFAYILGFHVPPKRSIEERSFPWLTEKRTGDRALTKAWLIRGGLISIARRKLRRGEVFSLNGLRYSIRRTLQVLSR